MKQPAVFLDRDGTIVDDAGYASRFDQMVIFPQSFEAVRRLNEAGLPVVVVTNQSGIGRGYLTEDELADIHSRLAESFAAAGARLDAFYSCPHFAASRDPRYGRECGCRKPLPGLGLQAAAELSLDLARSYMIGDKADDIRFARAIGATPVLVLTGYGRGARDLLEKGTDPLPAVAADILEAVGWILSREKSARK
ncbi:MAG: D-glycero-beta-D-manno-heptose-1,7-bisphosphate 7-phosphatase [Candidatus Aminicenantes bacterium ADurb.Bin147]|nr:MAG: D-glycero-beta-D-manno-heptose-1,7-bisphosphate 7-phosphatase [Candidatus Aminicenantes bacterium ADurb.Bin147]